MHDSLADPVAMGDLGAAGAPHAPDGRPREDPWKTSSALLLRLRDRDDQEAWAEFVARYTPMIRRWCRRWFARESDDLVQEILTKLVRSMGSFTYQSKPGRHGPMRRHFRSWLKTVARNVVAELRRRRRDHRWVDLPDSDLAAIAAAQTDLAERLIAEHERELLELAGERVCHRVRPATWAAFVETARNGRRAAEVARELGMPVGSVYQATYSVTRLLQREVEALEGAS